jgi:UDP-2,3-diacylglucosamine pyrophosphatase LpxH
MTNVARRVYIISDLHLGGRAATVGDRGFQMMTHAHVLADFLRRIAAERSYPVELVIAGDFVDFLAEDGELPGEWSPLIDDPRLATAVLRRMITDPARELGPVFAALRDVVAAGHVVTLLTGNHDIELSYPMLRQELLRALCARPGRGVHFVNDNEAYRIGDALIEHGNRYDAFNQVDHDRLRRRRSLQSRSQHVTRDDGFVPPLGSRLVAELMNPIKARYAFVDLLKPETYTVLPLLLALEPSLRGSLSRLLRTLAPALGRGLERDQPDVPVRLRDAAANGSESAVGVDEPAAWRSAAGDPLAATLGVALGTDAGREFLADIEHQQGAAEGASAVSDASAESRAFASSMWALLRSRKTQPIAARLPALHKALRAMQRVDAFRLDRETETTVAYQRAAEQLCERSDVRCVVFGHSHLARDIELGGGRKYLNTGTWANLLRIPDEVLEDDFEGHPRLAAWVEHLRDNTLEPWFRPTFARLEFDADDHVIEARTLEYTGSDPAVS